MKNFFMYLFFCMVATGCAVINTPVSDLEKNLISGDMTSARGSLLTIQNEKKLSEDSIEKYTLIESAFEKINKFDEKAGKFSSDPFNESFYDIEVLLGDIQALSKQISRYNVIGSSGIVNNLNYRIKNTNEKIAVLLAIKQSTAGILRDRLAVEDAIKRREEHEKIERQLFIDEQKRLAQQKQEQEQERIRTVNEDAREKLQQNKISAEKKNKQLACGADYGVLRIGMTIGRANECYGAFKLKNQINRADGIISTYWRGGTYIHVMGGRIVSWGQ